MDEKVFRNVYDFDGTIYNGDSTVDFYLFCLKKNPQIIKFLPHFIISLLRYKRKKITKVELKESFYQFLTINTIDEKLVLEFWKRNKYKIKQWYLNMKREDDVIISASPDFLLRPAIEFLEVSSLIASNVNIKTGKYIGENCYGKEKVERLYKEIKNIAILDFYSDSISDEPLAKLAEKAYLVQGEHLSKWSKS